MREIGRRRTPERSAIAGLTRREVEILRLVAEGNSNPDVARLLWITNHTVKFHLANTYRKLGIRNRIEASQWASKNGLIRRGEEQPGGDTDAGREPRPPTRPSSGFDIPSGNEEAAA